MERIRWTSFIVLSTVLPLVIQLLIINSVMAQAPNTSLAYNPNTSRIVDLKNHTITIIDRITDQPVSVCKFTPIETANKTINIGNVTTCENLTPVKPTINETLSTNTENATTNVNLSAKFNDLQGK
jgi:hypothetical protein